jgi:hypothetical protein
MNHDLKVMLLIGEDGVSVPENRRTSINIGEMISIRTISLTHDSLLAAIDQGEAVEIEMPASAEIDLCGIQLLESARLYAGVAGKTLCLATPVEAPVRDVLRRGGFLEQPTADFSEFWFHGEAGQ